MMSDASSTSFTGSTTSPTVGITKEAVLTAKNGGGGGGSEPLSCSICGSKEASKTKLFRHLEVAHGYIGPSTKPSKIVLIIGWLSAKDAEDQDDVWQKEDSYNAANGITLDLDEVETELFSAIRKMNDGTMLLSEVPGESRPKAYSRASKSSNLVATIVGHDGAASGVCDVISFHGRRLTSPMTDELWVGAVNSILPSNIRVLKRTTLNIEDFEFSAERHCTQRVYEYMIPLDILMPPQQQAGSKANSPDNQDTELHQESFDDDSDCDSDDSEFNEIKVKEFNPTFKIHDSKSHMNKIFPRTSEEAIRRILYFRKLKKFFVIFGQLGRASYHNYGQGGLTHDDLSCRRKVSRLFHKELVVLPKFIPSQEPSSSSSNNNSSSNRINKYDTVTQSETETTTWAIISCSADDFLRSQVRKMVAVSLAYVRGWLPKDILSESMLPDSTLKLPVVPGVGMFLSECKFAIWESKNQSNKSRFIHVLPRGLDATFSSVVSDSVNNTSDVDDGSDNGSDCVPSTIEGGVLAKGSEHEPANLSDLIERDPAIDRINQWRRDVKHHVAKQMTLAGVDWVKELKEKSLICAKQLAKIKALRSRDLTSPESAAAIRALHPCPAVYEKVLHLLREADRSGNWPDTSTNRKRVIADESTKDNLGGSFTVGALPAHMVQPKGNRVFPELTKACFELERALLPHRPGSGTIAINRHAQFKPHRDSGAGNGQSISLIVALGDFIGGEIVIEDQAHDIRYRPIEFDGWTERHWTLPFVGERYSIVFFTPNGVGKEDMWWLKDDQPPTDIKE